MTTAIPFWVILLFGCAIIAVILVVAFIAIWLLIQKNGPPKGFPVEPSAKTPGE
jgi:hypothetical protein